MAIEVGDAVLRFLGDSSQLDMKFAEVGPNAEKAFEPAAEAVEGAGERMQYSMREAQGSVMLLGEEVGVRLPRHVSRFIAELPGVGEAMSAAFSGVAILFVIEAIVKLTEKVTEATAEFLYAKSAWDESNKSLAESNRVLLDLQKQYEEVKKKADDYGKSALQLASEQKGAVKESITDLNKTLKEEEDHFMKLNHEISLHEKITLTSAQAWEAYRSGQHGALETFKAWLGKVDAATWKQKELAEVGDKLRETAGKLKVAHQELRVATNGVTTAQTELNKKGEELATQLGKLWGEINNLNRELNHTKVTASDVEIITPAAINNILKGIAAAHDLGITLKSDLVQGYTDAKKALFDYMNSGIQDAVVQKQITDRIKEAKAALDNYGVTVDQFKLKSHGLWKEFKDDAKDGATAMDHTKQIGVNAFDGITRGIESSIQAVILSQGSFATAMEKATAAALASVASQAIVKALFYTAEGFAALAGFEETSAGQYFTAAGIMGAVGAAAGLAGHALAGAAGGGGGGSRANWAGNNTSSNTSNLGASGSGLVSVQHFAEGGLISAPTLAVMGEQNKREAVLPLDDPEAKRTIGEALGGGTDGGIHFHLPHGSIISADVMTKFVGKMNRMVNRNQLHVNASNSYRVTKRSA